MKNKITQNTLVVILLGVVLLLNILSLRHKTLTDDESVHIPYGLNILKLNSDRLRLDPQTLRPDPESIINATMPFSCLNVIGGRIGELLKPGKLKDFLYRLNTARYVTVLFSVLLAFYVFRWTKELYGFVPGLFSLIIYTFSPNIIAHSRLVTLDLYAACMLTISTYYFWRFIKFGGWKRAAVSAFLLGLSQVAKYSCALLYPIFTLIILVRYSGDLLRLIRAQNFRGLARYLKTFSKFALFFIVVSIIIINIGFLFNRSFTPFGEYEFKSDSFKSLQSKLGILKRVPVPFPYPYIEGLDGHEFDEEQGGRQHGNLYLFGKLRRGGGFKGYFFYTFLYKVPIPIQLFIFFSIVAYILRRKRYNFLEDEAFLLCPVIFFTLYLNFFFTMHTGIRLLIIVFPLLHIFCGSLLKDWQTYSLKLRRAIIFLVIYLIISVLSYFPHYIPYFNELVWDRKQAYKILADSNINLGQNRWYLKKYKEEHPDIYIHPEYPVAGRVVVEINHLVGVFFPEKFRWLRENFEPVDHVAYSYLVYDIPEKGSDLNIQQNDEIFNSYPGL